MRVLSGLAALLLLATACVPAPATTSTAAPTVRATAPPSAATTPGVTSAPTTAATAATVSYLQIGLTDVRTGERFTLGGSAGKTVIVEGMAVW